MSALKYVPEHVLVEWYFNPRAALPTKKPRERFDHPVRRLPDAINLTMRFITAAHPPFGSGQFRGTIRTVKGKHGNLTLFWSVYEVREDTKVETPKGIRTKTVIYYYGFDAGRRLMVETVTTESWEDVYHQEYSWPRVGEIPPAHRAKLLDKLWQLRYDLQ